MHKWSQYWKMESNAMKYVKNGTKCQEVSCCGDGGGGERPTWKQKVRNVQITKVKDKRNLRKMIHNNL